MSTKAKSERRKARKKECAAIREKERARKAQRKAKERKGKELNAELCREVARRYRRLNPQLSEAEALAAVTKPELSREEAAGLLAALENETA